MTVTEDAGPGQTPSSGRDTVAVRLPATSAYLSVLRTVTAGLAAQLDFTLDEIEDLRIAVDEACGLLLMKSVGEGELECEFELGQDTLHVRVTAPPVDGSTPDQDSFAWNVLAALAGAVETHTTAGGRVTIAMHKQRTRAGCV